jgi:hypothetical protein
MELESRTARLLALSARALVRTFRGRVDDARRDGEDAMAIVNEIGWVFGATAASAGSSDEADPRCARSGACRQQATTYSSSTATGSAPRSPVARSHSDVTVNQARRPNFARSHGEEHVSRGSSGHHRQSLG